MSKLNNETHSEYQSSLLLLNLIGLSDMKSDVCHIVINMFPWRVQIFGPFNA